MKQSLKKILFKEEILEYENFKNEAAIGKFRLGGEIHQWMYDKYSLAVLLKESGFSDPIVVDACTSKIDAWNSYELDSQNGIVFKPDSLFMEAVK